MKHRQGRRVVNDGSGGGVSDDDDDGGGGDDSMVYQSASRRAGGAHHEGIHLMGLDVFITTLLGLFVEIERCKVTSGTGMTRQINANG